MSSNLFLARAEDPLQKLITVKFHFHTIISKLKTDAEGTKSAYAWLSLSAEKLTSFKHSL
jgi:hypothetical protein